MTNVTVTIDGQQLEVKFGATVLDAAAQLGIRIPTLCHVPGMEPASSCYVCAVQVEGQRKLSPACSLPVAEGMVVTTDSDDVRDTRKMALELLMSDHAGDCLAPCVVSCPAQLDVGGFMYEVAVGNMAKSVEVVAQNLALPGALGRVCPRLCEQTCRRCGIDESLAIAALHRYVADWDRAASESFVPPRAPSSGKSVAIVGAGPAGLAAATYLLPKGHDCTLYDAHPQPGGMLRYGIPSYRLPRAALDDEIDLIRKLGGTFRMNERWGDSFSLAQLREQHDAVFLAIGAQNAQGLRCEGEQLALSGVGFLERVELDDPPSLGRRIIVIGGGNTAMDASRTAVRVQAAQQEPDTNGHDSFVRVLYRRTRHEMPCLMDEVVAAEDEGVEIEYLVAPVALQRAEHGALQLTCQRMQLGEPDDSGRRRPVPIEGPDARFVIDCDTVIAAIGQSVDWPLAEREGLEVTGWGIAADPVTLATSLPGVFAGGDAVLGADLVVRAVAAGRMVASSIDQYLTGSPVTGEPHMTEIRMKPVDDDERAAIYRSIEQRDRAPMPHIDIEQRRTTFDEVETGLPAAQAEREARRCMSCGCRKADCCRFRNLSTEYDVDVNRFAGERRRFSQDQSHAEIIYEPGKCIMCDACVRIAADAGEPLGVTTIGRGFDVTMGVPFDRPLSEGLQLVAKQCAIACPSGALALRTDRACDLANCPLSDAALCDRTIASDDV